MGYVKLMGYLLLRINGFKAKCLLIFFFFFFILSTEILFFLGEVKDLSNTSTLHSFIGIFSATQSIPYKRIFS